MALQAGVVLVKRLRTNSPLFDAWSDAVFAAIRRALGLGADKDSPVKVRAHPDGTNYSAEGWEGIDVLIGDGGAHQQVYATPGGGWAVLPSGRTIGALAVVGNSSARTGEVVTVYGPLPHGEWWYEYPRACNAPACWTITDQCGTPMEGVTVTLKIGGTTEATGETDSSGKVCFSGLANGSYTASYSGIPDTYTTPDDLTVTIGPCGATVFVAVYPAPGLFIFGPGQSPRAPAPLYLCTPYGEVKLETDYVYSLQQPEADPNSSLIGWHGEQQSRPYEVDLGNGDGSTCTVYDRIYYRVQYWPCGNYGLQWHMTRCGMPIPNPDPGGGGPAFVCNESPCSAEFGRDGLFTDYQQSGWTFYSCDGCENGGTPPGTVVPNIWPTGSASLAANTSGDGVAVDFGAPGRLGNPAVGDCGASGLSAYPGWCCGEDAVILSTWHLALSRACHDPISGAGLPLSTSPVPLTLYLSDSGGSCYGGYGPYGASGNQNQPSYVTVSFDSNAAWGSLGGTTISLAQDGDPPDWVALCVASGTVGTCGVDGSAALGIVLAINITDDCTSTPDGTATVSVQVTFYGDGSCATACVDGAAGGLSMTLNGTSNLVSFGNGAGEIQFFDPGSGTHPAPSPDPAVLTIKMGCP